MFNFFKRETRTSLMKLLEGAASLPLDADYCTVFMDDRVKYRGKVFEVVAMSHKGKLAIRKPGRDNGAFWVPSRNCILLDNCIFKED